MKNRLFKTCLTGLALSVAGLANATTEDDLVNIFKDTSKSHAVTSGAAVMITAGSTVNSDIAAQAAIAIGAESCTQDISAGAAVIIGANSRVGNINAGAGTGIGARADAGNIVSGGATILGANAQVDSVTSGGATLLGAGSSTNESSHHNLRCPKWESTAKMWKEAGTTDNDTTNNLSELIVKVQEKLSKTIVVGKNDLFTTLGTNEFLMPGVHAGTMLTIVAGSVVTFQGDQSDNDTNHVWVTGALNVGAGTKFLISGVKEGDTATIIWNVGSAVTLGAGTKFIGVAFVNGAFNAASSEVSCGNIFATGAVSIGTIRSPTASSSCQFMPID
jgi:hypothetical protein